MDLNCANFMCYRFGLISVGLMMLYSRAQESGIRLSKNDSKGFYKCNNFGLMGNQILFRQEKEILSASFFCLMLLIFPFGMRWTG
jgi:hypothetical protein